ncbi:GldG family protein [Pseudomonas citronellolis]|uniref:GldG family protein n=1 Tax=Pseudomonas citronellolis TaxID=53408 RepID=UPI0023E3667A|nr:Gldg family protein [Pseudomonas citronellolis]MDF3931952.1 Gldg family protein [Pseudomonas citronellolis]
MKKVMYSGAGLLVIGLLFLAFNLVSGLAFTGARLDLTQQKLYTISDGTKKVLGSIGEPINLYFFFSDKGSKDLVPLRNYAKRVEELLKAYERAADGKIRLHIIDPQPFSEEEDRAAEFGLQAVPLSQGGDTLYFGLAGSNALDDTQAIPFFQPDHEELLEYDISRLVNALAHPKRPVVGVLSTLPMNGGFDMQTQQPGSPWMLLEEVRQQFDLKSLKVDVDTIPADVSVLLLVHPKHLPQPTLYAIDQFVLRGGKLLVFVDPFSEADKASPMAALDGPGDQASDLEPLFRAWGVRLLSGKVVGDGSYAMSVSLGQGQPPAHHPAWLNLDARALDASDVATAGLENLTLATAGILEPLADAKTRFTPLIRSSNLAMPFDAQRFATLRDPGELMAQLKPTGQRYVLAARIQGPARSAFPDGIEGHKDGLKGADSINVIAVADTDLLTDRMWVQVQEFYGQRVPQPWADNASFVINALDNLAGSDALISVRSRGRFSRPFTVVDDLQRQAETRFREKADALKQRLADTEQKLAALQNQDPSKVLELTPEQQGAVQQFIQERVRIRKELRDVQFQLNEDIDALGRTLKIINIVAVPLLLTLGVLALWLWRRRRQL